MMFAMTTVSAGMTVSELQAMTGGLKDTMVEPEASTVNRSSNSLQDED